MSREHCNEFWLGVGVIAGFVVVFVIYIAWALTVKG